MNELKPCRDLTGGDYRSVGSLCGLPLRWDKSLRVPPGATQYTEVVNYSKKIPEVPNKDFVPAIEQWEPGAPWRIVLHTSNFGFAPDTPCAFEYAGPFDNLEAAVVAYMLLWP